MVDIGWESHLGSTITVTDYYVNHIVNMGCSMKDMGLRKLLRLLAYWNVSFLLIITLSLVKILNINSPIIPESILFLATAIFLILETANAIILCRKGIFFFFTCPVLWTKVLLYDSNAHQPNSFITGFFVIMFIYKGIELLCAIIKRRKNQIVTQDYFSSNMELAIITSILFDVVALL